MSSTYCCAADTQSVCDSKFFLYTFHWKNYYNQRWYEYLRYTSVCGDAWIDSPIHLHIMFQVCVRMRKWRVCIHRTSAHTQTCTHKKTNDMIVTKNSRNGGLPYGGFQCLSSQASALIPSGVQSASRRRQRSPTSITTFIKDIPV